MADPKFYFENSLIGEREDKLFVFMPFSIQCQKRFDEIIKPATEFMNFNVEKVDDEKSAKEVMEKVFDGINVSRILLFDLSQDERYDNKVNPNVAYELGIARMVRNDTDIMLITDMNNIEEEIFFDIRQMNIIKIDSDFTKESFRDKLKDLFNRQNTYQDKRIEKVSKLIDDGSIRLMYDYGRRPKQFRHFNSDGVGAEMKLSALRLLDMGIIVTKWGCYSKGFEAAYHWTSFGEAVMKNMGIVEIDLKTFKGTKDYQVYLKFQEHYKKQKEKMI